MKDKLIKVYELWQLEPDGECIQIYDNPMAFLSAIGDLPDGWIYCIRVAEMTRGDYDNLKGD